MIKSFFERCVADIHEVTLETEGTILSAEIFYNYLSDEEKEQVNESYSALVIAREKLDRLLEEEQIAKQKEIAEREAAEKAEREARRNAADNPLQRDPAWLSLYGPIKVKAPEREPGSVLRRTDFHYLNGHGTFYRFDKDHLPENILSVKYGDHVSLVLYNLHTDQLDEVVFTVESTCYLSEGCLRIRGFIDDIDDCFAIKIEYELEKPLKSYILVFASARPDYKLFERL